MKDVKIRVQKQFKAKEVSTRIQAVIAWSDEEVKSFCKNEGRMKFTNFDIKGVMRYYPDIEYADGSNWHPILEILPTNFIEAIYPNSIRPMWMKKEDVMGTSTTNIPPEKVIKEVISNILTLNFINN